MNLQELKDKISLITNETKVGANTAERIGSTMLDILNYTTSEHPIIKCDISSVITFDEEGNMVIPEDVEMQDSAMQIGETTLLKLLNLTKLELIEILTSETVQTYTLEIVNNNFGEFENQILLKFDDSKLYNLIAGYTVNVTIKGFSIIDFKLNDKYSDYVMAILQTLFSNTHLYELKHIVSILLISYNSSDDTIESYLFIDMGGNEKQNIEFKTMSAIDFSAYTIINNEFNLGNSITPTTYHITNDLTSSFTLYDNYDNFNNYITVIGNFTINNFYTEQISIIESWPSNDEGYPKTITITDPGTYQFMFANGKLTINKTYN